MPYNKYVFLFTLLESCGSPVVLLNLAILTVSYYSRLSSGFLDYVILMVEGRASEFNTNHEITRAYSFQVYDIAI